MAGSQHGAPEGVVISAFSPAPPGYAKAHAPAVRRRSALGRTAVGLGLLSLGLGVFGALAARFGLVGPRLGLGISTAGAGCCAVLGLVTGIVALGRALMAKPRLGLRGSAVAIALNALLTAFFAASLVGANREPPIHDAATDWRDPLTPSAQLVTARGDAALPIEAAPAVPDNAGSKAFAGRTVAEINAKTCPGATAVIRAEPVDRAYSRVRDAVKRMGMTLVSDDVRSGRLEATATSAWYRFKDDLIVRVRPENAGARIDFRASSRDRVHDHGADCAHVTRLRQALAG